MPYGFHGDSGPAPRFALSASVSPPDGADEEPNVGSADGNRRGPREEAAAHPEVFRRGGLEPPGGFRQHSTAAAGEPGVDPAVPENRIRASEIVAARSVVGGAAPATQNRSRSGAHHGAELGA